MKPWFIRSTIWTVKYPWGQRAILGWYFIEPTKENYYQLQIKKWFDNQDWQRAKQWKQVRWQMNNGK